MNTQQNHPIALIGICILLMTGAGALIVPVQSDTNADDLSELIETHKNQLNADLLAFL